MKKKTLIASIALAAITTHAAASQSLIETYEQAVANDPSLAIAQLESTSAQQDVISGFANVLPKVSASAKVSVYLVCQSSEQGSR